MKNFQSMSLDSELAQALADLKFVEPTKIQSAVIPAALEGKDLMACAETGSGKTGAYCIPMVTQLLADRTARALILAPTRELAQQIAEFARELTVHCDDIKVTSLVGGADIRKQLKQLKLKPRIIVGTPGRMIDHLKRRSLNLKSTKTLILDEGDRMLDMGFSPQLDQILTFLPKQRQSSLFTATLSPKVQVLAEKYLIAPKKINVGRASQPVATVKQSVVQVKVKDKEETIVDELNAREGSVIVFTRTKRRTDGLAKTLREYGFQVDLIHGGRTQGQRNKAIRSFKEGNSRILCATDVAARGIDVPQVEHVINYDLPMMDEDYVHRIGRTARNGAKGEAVSFVTPEDRRTWEILIRKYRIQGVDLVKNFQTKRRATVRTQPTKRIDEDGALDFDFDSDFDSKRKARAKAKYKSDDRSRTNDKPKRRYKSDRDEDSKPVSRFKKKFGSDSKSGLRSKKFDSDWDNDSKPRSRSKKFSSDWDDDSEPGSRPKKKFSSRWDDDSKPRSKSKKKFSSRWDDDSKPRSKSKKKFSSRWDDDSKPRSGSKKKFGSSWDDDSKPRSKSKRKFSSDYDSDSKPRFKSKSKFKSKSRSDWDSDSDSKPRFKSKSSSTKAGGKKRRSNSSGSGGFSKKRAGGGKKRSSGGRSSRASSYR